MTCGLAPTPVLDASPITPYLVTAPAIDVTGTSIDTYSGLDGNRAPAYSPV